jgi:multiple sugar transport system substrate-binding protein
MSKRITLLAVLALLVVLPFSVQAQDKIVVTWFVGLGTGTQPAQIDAQNQVVADFNASQDAIELVINIGADFTTSRDTFSTLVAAGTAPDIVGPVGVGGSNAFQDVWADLTPLVEAASFDLSVFDPALVDLYRTGDGQLLGIPFAVFPSLTYYNVDLFDEAGLNYPPSDFESNYVMPDGTEVPWDYNTVKEIGMILTVDANGNDATSPDFDPTQIVQFGMNFQWAQQRLMWTHLQPEDWYDEEANVITIPESWVEGSLWIQDAVWTSHFMPSATYAGSDLFGASNVFQTGNLGMAVTPLWYTCCLSGSVGNFTWDMAVVPRSLDGEYHVATDADTFRLTKGSQNPEAAFTVLSYLLTEAVPTLAPTYGAFPALPDAQQSYLDTLTTTYEGLANTSVITDSLAYNNPGSHHHESFHPNWQQGADRTQAFSTLLFGDTGAEIDVVAESETMEADLNAIVSDSE